MEFILWTLLGIIVTVIILAGCEGISWLLNNGYGEVILEVLALVFLGIINLGMSLRGIYIYLHP